MPRKKAVIKPKNNKKTTKKRKGQPKKANGLQVKSKEKTRKQELNEKKVEREKSLIMWSGVTFFMVLILALWVININITLKNNASQKSNSQFNLLKASQDFNLQIKDLKQSFQEFKKNNNTATNSPNNLSSDQTASSSADKKTQTASSSKMKNN